MSESYADVSQAPPEPLPNDPQSIPALERDGLVQPIPDQPSFWTRVASWFHERTVADALVALAVLVGALLRFTNLGTPLLSPTESSAALSSWSFGQPGATITHVISPAYFTLTNAAMIVFGSSDAIARLVPALFGTATIALAYFLGHGWRSVGMVVVASFLALSPLNVLVSRTAGGGAIAVFALVLLLVSDVLLQSSERKVWAYALGTALGLGMTSDPLFISGLVALAPVWLWMSRPSELDETIPGGGVPAFWRSIAIAFGVSFILLSTSFLLYTPGLGAAFGIATTWLSRFGLPTLDLSTSGIFGPFLTALRYEPALLVLGLPALIWALARRGNLGWLLAGWWVLLMLLSLFHSDHTGFALLFTVPGYLLIGLFARSLFSQKDNDARVTLAVAGGLTLLGMILLVSIARYTRMALWSTDQVAFLVLALVAFVAAGGVLVLAMSYNSAAARKGAFLGLAAVLLYVQWGTATTLTQLGSNDPRELAVIDGTDDDVRILSNLMGDLSRQISGGDHDLEVVVTADTPVLRWYLREFERAQFGPTLPIQAAPQAVIAPADAELRLGVDFLGADFGLRQASSSFTSPFSLSDTLKWLLFRESSTPVEVERVILWVRSDLTGGGTP